MLHHEPVYKQFVNRRKRKTLLRQPAPEVSGDMQLDLNRGRLELVFLQVGDKRISTLAQHARGEPFPT